MELQTSDDNVKHWPHHRQMGFMDRLRFADVAYDKLWVAGAHLPFPAIGHMCFEGEGDAWGPVGFGPLRSNC